MMPVVKSTGLPRAPETLRAATAVVFREQLGGRSPARLILKIEIDELLGAAVFDDKSGVQVFGGPWRREAACG
jgi:hypothetical protein